MKKEKKIYIVSLNGIKNAGGVEKVTFYLNEILKEKYNVKIITKNKLNFGKLNNVIHPFFISLKLFFIPNKIVISNSWHSFLYPADYSIHHGTSAGILLRTGEGGLAAKLTAILEKKSARLAQNILAVGENCKNELIDLYGIDNQKIKVLNNFVDESFFTVNVSRTDSKVIKVLFCGALGHKKGLNKLIDFSNYIERNECGLELYIASNYNNNVSFFKNNSKTHIFTDISFDKMNEFYQKGDVLYFPTLYEGFSMAVLEALSSGLPVVGSNFAVSPELEKYDFCKMVSNEESNEKILNEIKSIYNKYNNQKNYIHETISKDFGKNQYKEKLLSLINN